MGHSVGEAAKRSTAKGEVQKNDEAITNAKKIHEIRSNLASGLATSNFYIQGLLEEHDLQVKTVAILAESTKGLLARAETAETSLSKATKEYQELLQERGLEEVTMSREQLDDPKTWEGIGQSTSEQSQTELEPLPSDTLPAQNA